MSFVSSIGYICLENFAINYCNTCTYCLNTNGSYSHYSLAGSEPGFQKCLSKTAIPIYLPVPIQPLIYYKSLYQLHLKAYCVKKANLHFSYVLKGGLLGRYLVVNPKKSKLKILYRNFLQSFFLETYLSKRPRRGLRLSPRSVALRKLHTCMFYFGI